jgi:flagellin-like protein
MVKRGAFILFKGKRGLSPLIATVLLIAFAVAMGAMIMNWSSTIGESAGGPDCSGISLIMNPIICYKENMIKVNIKNTGELVNELELNIVDDTSVNKLALKNSILRKGDSLNKEIPFSKTSKTSVRVIPSIQHNGKIVPCVNPALEVADIQECST